MTQLSELLADPMWFPAALDTNAGTVGFARISRGALSEEAFLDQRMAGSVTGRETASLADVMAAVASQPHKPPPAFIFHTAFCCSTLLASALDVPGSVLALKEPNILMDLANVLRVDAKAKQSRKHAEALVQTVVSLLATSASSENVLIKPTNAANNLLPYVIKSGAPVLLLYGSLRSFLISVLKKGEACKSFVRGQYNIFALDPDGLVAIPQRQAVGFTDLQAAAVVWRHQSELFQRALAATGRDQAVSLDFKRLTATPAPVLQAVTRHLKLPHDTAKLESIANGPVFKRNAKFTGQAFSPEQVVQDTGVIEERYGETLDLIENWAKQLSLGTTLSTPLSGAIVA